MQQRTAIPRGDWRAAVARSDLPAWQGKMHPNPVGQARAPIPPRENPSVGGHTLVDKASLRTMANLGLRWGDNSQVDKRFKTILRCVHDTLEDVRHLRRDDLQDFIGFVFPDAPVAEESRSSTQTNQLASGRLGIPVVAGNVALAAELQRAGLPTEAADMNAGADQGLFQPHGKRMQEVLPPDLVPPPSAVLWNVDESVDATTGGRGASQSNNMPVSSLLVPPSSAALWKVDEAVTGTASSQELSPRSSGSQGDWRAPAAESKEVWKNTAPNYIVKNTFVEPADIEVDKSRVSAGHFFSEQPRRRQIDPDEAFPHAWRG